MIAFVAAPVGAMAQDSGVIQKAPTGSKVTIDFRQAPLEEVVEFFSSMLQQNFVIADTIQANKTITIVSPKPVEPSEAHRVFLVALQMNGLSVIESGGVLEIVEAKQAGQEEDEASVDGGADSTKLDDNSK